MRFEDEPAIGSQVFILWGSGHPRSQFCYWTGPCFVNEIVEGAEQRLWRVEYPNGERDEVGELTIDLWVDAAHVRQARNWKGVHSLVK